MQIKHSWLHAATGETVAHHSCRDLLKKLSMDINNANKTILTEFIVS